MGGDRSGDSRQDDDEGGLSFSLPPVRLPPVFPVDFELRFPFPARPRTRNVSTGGLLAACLLFDLADAALALAAPGTVAGVRAVAGTALASTLAWPLGVFYVWEVAAALLGFDVLTVVPTLTMLVALRAVR